MMQKKMKKKRINQFDDFVTIILNIDESSDPFLIFRRSTIRVMQKKMKKEKKNQSVE